MVFLLQLVILVKQISGLFYLNSIGTSSPGETIPWTMFIRSFLAATVQSPSPVPILVNPTMFPAHLKVRWPDFGNKNWGHFQFGGQYIIPISNAIIYEMKKGDNSGFMYFDHGNCFLERAIVPPLSALLHSPCVTLLTLLTFPPLPLFFTHLPLFFFLFLLFTFPSGGKQLSIFTQALCLSTILTYLYFTWVFLYSISNYFADSN